MTQWMSHIMNFFGRKAPTAKAPAAAAAGPVKPVSAPTRPATAAPVARPQLVPVAAAPSSESRADGNALGVPRRPAQQAPATAGVSRPSAGGPAAVVSLAALNERLGRPWLGHLTGIVAPSMFKQLIALNLGCGDAALLGTAEALGEAHAQTVRQMITETWAMNLVTEIVATPVVLDALSQRLSSQGGLSQDKLFLSVYDQIVEMAIAAKASDVHFTGDDTAGVINIHLRIYGQYRYWRTNKSKLVLGALAAAFGQRSKSDTATKEQFNAVNPVAFMTSQDVNGSSWEGRVNGRPHITGYAGTMRLLESTPKVDKIPTLEELGYSTSHQEIITGSVLRNFGLIILFGSTGSGKSTTLRTFMTRVSDPTRLKTYTAESPAEYVMPGVTQFSMPVDVTLKSEDIQAKFTALLRDLMRMDPDVLMVGEVRDQETGRLVSELTQTGHRCYTTAHGDGAVDGLARLCGGEIRMPPDTLAGSKFLSASLYQRLLPVLCPHCKIPATDSTNGLSTHKQRVLRDRYQLDAGTMFVANASGCSHCKPKIPGLEATGTLGVTVAVEILIPTPRMRTAIANRDWTGLDESWRAQRRAAFADGDMLGKTAFEHALWLVAQGRVSLLDVESEFEPIDSYEIRPIRSGAPEMRAA